MNRRIALPAGNATDEISALIETLHETGQRLEELTAGEVDSVVGSDGRTFLLRHAQEQLRHSEAARQAAILNALPAHIALLDTRGVIVSVNDAWRQFGVANVLHGPGHAVGVDYLGICDRARDNDAVEAPQVAAGIRAVLGGSAKSFSLEYPCHAPAEQRWFLMTVTPLDDEHRNGVVVMHLNITERRQITHALRESERRFSDMLQNVQLVAVMLDRDARITYCNDYFLRLTGWQREEVIGQDWFERFMPPELGNMKPVFAALMANSSDAWHREDEIFTRAGARRRIRWNNSVLRSGAGEVIGTASIGEDITERKTAEARIVYLNRVYALLSGINTLIVRVRDRDELFREACRIAVEAGGFSMSLIGIVDHSAAMIVPVASAGKTAHLQAAVKRLTSSREIASTTMVARAIREKRPVVANDSQHDPQVLLGRQYAESGVRSMAILPLIVADVARGALALYAGESEFFHAEEMALLTELSGDIAFAIAHIDVEEKAARLSRIQAIMSAINAAIVRVRDRQVLFNEACRIVVEHGKFGMAWIGGLDPATQDVTPIAWAGENAAELAAIKSSARDDTSRGMGAVGKAIRERRAVFNNDIAAGVFGGPRAAQILKLGFRSQITLPLFDGHAVVGTLTMYSEEPGYFIVEELALLTELAGNISFALEHIGKEEKIARLSRVKAVTGGINALIVRVRDRQQLFEGVCRIAVNDGKFGMAWIGEFNPATLDVRPVAWAGIGTENLGPIDGTARADEPKGQGTVGRAIREKQAAFDNDIAASPGIGGGRRAEAVRRGFRSLIALPFIVEGVVAGHISLFAKEPDFFDQEEVTLLTVLAGDISYALENIRKEEKIASLNRVEAVTSGINSLIVRVRERQELFNEVCRIAVEYGKFGTAWIGVLDCATLEVSPVAWAGHTAENFALDQTVGRSEVADGTGVVSRAIREKHPVFENDIIESSANGHGPRRAAAVRAGFHSLIAVPFVVRDSVVGHLSLYAREANVFDEQEVQLLAALARNISFAIESLERQEKLAKLSRIRAVSGEINAAIARFSEHDALLKEVCRIAADYGKFELVWVALIDAEQQEIRPVAWTGFAPEIAHAVTWADLGGGTAMLGEVMQTRRPAVRNDIETALGGGGLRREARKQGCRSAVCLPLLVDNNVSASIILFAMGRDFFDTNELALLTEVAADVSLALQSIVRREQLDYLAYYDALTGLANRTLFHERLEQSVTTAKEQGRKVALLMLDIERFKNINDTLGRQVGDALLKEVAVRASARVTDAGRLARLDADHFTVMVTDLQTEEELARLIEQRIGEIFGPPFRIGEHELRISAKFGIAIFPADGADADTLFSNAEAALENAKAHGDRYLFYTQSMNARVAEKLSLENRLRQALEQAEFVLHYQPKVNLTSGKLTGAEALIRWNDPQTGLVPPGRFIPLLEETGLIYEVGRWALRQAIADYLRWRAAGLPAVRIAVNVSPLQLRNRGFISEIEQVIGIDAGAAAGLELEITESLIMEDVKHNIASLKAIRALGVTIAIDDFGTGFSSLSYLAKLPVDTLKIDRSFVIDMTAGPQGLSLVSTIINLAHSMKLKVVAEGVETEEQSRLLRLLRCDEMQGYLFSKPVAGEIFETKFLAPAGPPGDK